MITIGATFVLVLVYSPQSAYFGGYSFEQKSDQESCLTDARASIGKMLETRGPYAWETQMMGPRPKVVAAYCAPGVAPE